MEEVIKSASLSAKTIRLSGVLPSSAVEQEDPFLDDMADLFADEDGTESNAGNVNARQSAPTQSNQDKELARIKKEARDQAYEDAYEKISEQARKEGYDDGFQLGIEEAEQKIAENLAEQKQKFIEFREKIELALLELEERLKNDSSAMAEKLLYKLVGDAAQQQTFYQDVIKNAIDSIGDIRFEKIRVAGADKEYVEELLGASSDVQIEVASDLRGGCIIETDMGLYDAKLEHQLEELHRVLSGKRVQE